MAKIDKEDWKSTPDSDEQAKRERGEQSVPDFEHESLAVQLLFDKLNEAIDLSNSQVDSIALNTAKTGITSSQSSAIAANTAKTGITTAQASAIVANTAKTGVTSTQASQLTGLSKGQIPVGAGTLVIEFNAKTNGLTFTYRQGKVTKVGGLTLK